MIKKIVFVYFKNCLIICIRITYREFRYNYIGNMFVLQKLSINLFLLLFYQSKSDQLKNKYHNVENFETF